MKKQWYLALDYGRSWIGIAVGNTEFGVSTLSAIKYNDRQRRIGEIVNIAREYEVNKIVMGIPDGLLVEEIKELGTELEKVSGIEVDYQNEHRSSQQVAELTRANNIPTHMVKEGQHSLAAVEILRRYLADSRNNLETKG